MFEINIDFDAIRDNFLELVDYVTSGGLDLIDAAENKFVEHFED